MKNKLGMGSWKSRVIKKQGKASRTKSSPARLYTVAPPKSGWPGGRPEDNGYRRGSK